MCWVGEATLWALVWQQLLAVRCVPAVSDASILLPPLPSLLAFLLQVFELQPGVESGAIWQEVWLLRRCTHERIVPLLGVAVKVCEARLPLQWPPKLQLLAPLLLLLLASMFVASSLTTLALSAQLEQGCAAARLLAFAACRPACPPASGPAAAGSNAVYAWRQPAGCAAAARDAARTALGS